MNVFSSAQCAPSDIKVLQISDMHLFASTEEQLVGVNTEHSFLSVLKLAQKESWPPDLIILTGDLSQDASEASYTRLISHLTTLNIPCYVLPGNHDTPNTLADIFNKPPVLYKPFVHHNNWLLTFLNSETPNEEGGTLDDNEVENLHIEVKQHPDKHVLICLHHQLKAVGSEWLDTMTVKNPDALTQLITESTNVRGIIHGHVHQEFESDIAGKPIYAVPSTCFQFKPLSKEFAIDNIAPGYRWLRLQENGQIITNVVRQDKAPDNLEQNSAGY